VQWRPSVINLGGPGFGHLSPSFNPPFFHSSRGLSRGLGRAHSPAAKHFDANYTAKQRYKIHSDV